MAELRFKEAESAFEFQQIHELNHRIFAEEVGQYESRPSGLLIDRLHEQNRYFIAIRGTQVVGMVSAHQGPEFSVSKRLPSSVSIRDFDCPLEVRQLAIHPQERHRTILAGLLWQLYNKAVSGNVSHILISGISSKESLYRKLGFRPLGPAIPEGGAEFIPMAMTIADLSEYADRRVSLYQRHYHQEPDAKEPISLMPGPVCIHPEIRQAYARPPISHRSTEFQEKYKRCIDLLNGLLPGTEAVIFTGSGTLANDSVAANLKSIYGSAPGLVISNGEFGERLIHQARAAGLSVQTLSFPWAATWDLKAVDEAIRERPAWIWAVHLETSTGVLNDIGTLLRTASRAGVRVALDCVSSIGAVQITESGNPPLMISAVSGKSLGAYAGLAFVSLSEECRQALKGKSLCPSFDLLSMHEASGPLSTIPSAPLDALCAALERGYSTPTAALRRYKTFRLLANAVRQRMRASGLEPLAPEAAAAPNIATFTLPDAQFPAKCRAAGYQIAYASAYLRTRNWGQIATMGNVTWPMMQRFFDSLPAKSHHSGRDA